MTAISFQFLTKTIAAMEKIKEIKQTFPNGNSRAVTISAHEWGVKALEYWYYPDGRMILSLTTVRRYRYSKIFDTLQKNVKRAISRFHFDDDVQKEILDFFGDRQVYKERNDVTSFFYYMWNRWSEEECKEVFKDDYYPHFWNKWCEAYDTMHGPRGAAEYFYMTLSDTNRDKLVKRALECYDGMSEKH